MERHASLRSAVGGAAATAIAGVGILLSVVLLLAFVMLGQQMSAYGRCLSAAARARPSRLAGSSSPAR